MKSPVIHHLREILLIVCGKLSTQVALLFSSILIARTSLPSEFGVYASALVMITMIDAIVGTPLDVASTRFAGVYGIDSERALRIQSLVFRCKLAFGISALILSWPIRDRIAELFFTDPHRGSMLTIVLCGSLALLLLRGTSVFLQNCKAFRRYAILDIATGLVRLTAVLALYYLGIGEANTYLSAYGAVTFFIFLITVLVFHQPYIVAAISERRDVSSCLHFVGFTFGIAVLGTLNAKADLLIASSLYGSDLAGQYAVAYQVAQFGTMLAFFVSITTQPRIIPMAINNQLGRLAGVNILAVLVASALLIPIASTVVPIVLPFVFGDAFAPASEIALILLLGVLADWLTIPVFFPLALQIFPCGIFLGEAFLLIGYAAAIVLVKDYNINTFAVLVAMNRFAHFALYAAFGWFFLRLPLDSRRKLIQA